MTELIHIERLKQLEKRFSDWRISRNGKQRIPKELWIEAVDLCKHIQFTKVANTLKLSLGSLRNKLNLQQVSESLVASNPQETFKAVSFSEIEGLFSQGSTAEILSPNGYVLRLHSIDLEQTIKTFLQS